MPLYKYTGQDFQGRPQKGSLSAGDQAVALDELRRRSLIVLSLNESKESIWTKEFYLGRPVKNEEFVVYCRQFATLIRAGVSLVDATRILAEQSDSRPLKKALTGVLGSLREGNSFSQSAAEHPSIFPPIFINMIMAGEEAGDMEDTLDRLATFFEREHYTREKIKSALTYPITVGIITLLVVGILLKFVIPRFESMFSEMGAELPAVTRGVLAMSRSFEQFWYLWLLSALLLGVAFHVFKRSAQGAYALDYMSLKLPVFGKLNRKSAIARMTRTLASLYSSSVPLLQSLSIVEDVVGNRVIGMTLQHSRESLRKGLPLSEPFKKAWVFPPLVTQMIAIGEESGSLDLLLGKIADFYEKDVENTVDKLKALLEPLLIVFLAGIVGLIVGAVLLPVFDIYGKISGM